MNDNALKELRISNDAITYIKNMVALMQATKSKYKDARLLAYKFTKERLDDCILLIDKNRTLLEDIDLKFLVEAQNAHPQLPIYSASDLAIDGHDILKITNRPAGRWLREVIQALETHVLLGELNNDKDSLTDWVKTHDDFA